MNSIRQPSAAVFELVRQADYANWRAHKLERLCTDAAQLRVEIVNPVSLRQQERARMQQLLGQHNIVIYRITGEVGADKAQVRELGKHLGLERLDNNLRADEDSITSLEVRPQQGNQYIPYTSRRLSWHTDGYYNRLDRQINGIIMHCVQPAAEGGENALIDHELMYLRLRDENPAYIEALMQPQAMTIPPNVENGVELRAAQSGPVFSLHPGGWLHMRYSARQRHIEWCGDAITRAAADAITDFLSDDSIVCRVRLCAGEGIVCNNVLHNRSGFSDSAAQKRLMYRARYYDRAATS